MSRRQIGWPRPLCPNNRPPTKVFRIPPPRMPCSLSHTLPVCLWAVAAVNSSHCISVLSVRPPPAPPVFLWVCLPAEVKQKTHNTTIVTTDTGEYLWECLPEVDSFFPEAGVRVLCKGVSVAVLQEKCCSVGSEMSQLQITAQNENYRLLFCSECLFYSFPKCLLSFM